MARLFGLLPKTFHYWYKHALSDYMPDKASGKWGKERVEVVDKKTGEVSEKPLYVFKEENLGETMSIDDKAIGHDGFTILSNPKTGKIALMLESTRAEEVGQALEKFGGALQKIRHISMDMSPTYLSVFSNLVPHATQVIDKFHVMKYAYQAVGEVRSKAVKALQQQLSPGKKRTEEDKKLLAQIELLRRVSHAITQSPDSWNKEMQAAVSRLFSTHDELKKAYQISQDVKRWYRRNDNKDDNRSAAQIHVALHQWYGQARQVPAFEGVVKMVRKHETEIVNFFQHSLTNAKAENLNGKLQRFVSNNYGIKDKDFFLYRTAHYFS